MKTQPDPPHGPGARARLAAGAGPHGPPRPATAARDRLSALARWAGRRLQGFAALTLLVALAAQAGAAVLIAQEPHRVASRFAREASLLALAGAGVSVAVLAAGSRKALWSLFALRLLLLAALLGALRGGDPVLQLMVVIAPLIESAAYERLPAAMAANAGILALFAAVALGGSQGAGAAPLIAVLSAAAVSALYLLTQHYREALVRSSRRIESLEHAFEQLTDSNLGLQLYASSAEHVSANRERARVTRELHDAVGYALTNISMMMKAARVLIRTDLEKLAEMTEMAHATANEALREARRILYRLRAVDDEAYQGMGAISRLVKAYGLATSVDVEVDYGNVEWSLGRDLDGAFYRAVQEGLTNAYRHGGAGKVRIRMWMGGDHVTMRIWDNGRGAEAINEGIGLKGMRERMERFGGTVQARRAPDGFELTVRVPWRTAGAP